MGPYPVDLSPAVLRLHNHLGSDCDGWNFSFLGDFLGIKDHDDPLRVIDFLVCSRLLDGHGDSCYVGIL
jgi:hypothetical protein